MPEKSLPRVIALQLSWRWVKLRGIAKNGVDLFFADAPLLFYQLAVTNVAVQESSHVYVYE